MTDHDSRDEPFFEGGSESGRHPPARRRRLPVAPQGEGDAFNTVRLPIIAVACWRMNDAMFEFDSSFPRPALSRELPRLADLVRAHPNAQPSVFGHGDPVGYDEYNKVLAGRRAAAIYGLLTRDAELWDRLYQHPFETDRWDLRTLQRMLGSVPRPDGEVYYAGAAHGHGDEATRTALREFQKAHGLPASGLAGPDTRWALYLAYMDAICLGPDDRFVIAPSAFVGRGEAVDRKGALQGCSEFNPVLIISEADEARYASCVDKSERNAHNAPNRRVMVFLFESVLPIDVARWPCPTWLEGPAGCHAQFWPDAASRRRAGAEEREYRSDRKTMACRFYDRHARRSPCEGIRYEDVHIRLFDSERRPTAGVRYRATVGRQVIMGHANAHGVAVLENVLAPARCKIEWSPFSSPPSTWDDDRDPTEDDEEVFRHEKVVFVEADYTGGRSGTRQRLSNLGYSEDAPLAAVVRDFQHDYGLDDNGDPDDPIMLAKLATVHTSLAPNPLDPSEERGPDDEPYDP